jgi:hypothetical protein
MLETCIVMILLVFCLVLLLVLHLVSFMDPSLMVLVHERIALYLDALLTTLVLIVVIVPYVGTVFLLEGPSFALSQDIWTVHIFPIVVHVTLTQMVRC